MVILIYEAINMSKYIPKYTLPKPYISYSAYKLWKTSRASYRARYYDPLNSVTFSTAETRFGKAFAEMMENRHTDLAHVPSYEITEHEITVSWPELGGINVFGKLDSFDQARLKFLDHKTSHKSKTGKAPWSKSIVHRHEQLPFYSMLIQEKYGKVDPVCHIVWLETKVSNPVIRYEGYEFEQGKQVNLIGRPRKFRRYITQKERNEMKESIVKVVKEISRDYKKYLKTINI